MILVVSESIDASTNDVIDWLLQSSKVIRGNKDDIEIISVNYESDEIVFKYKHTEIISAKDISAFWYRRGSMDYAYNLNFSSQNELLQDHIFYHLDAEWNEVIRYFFEQFINEKHKHLGSYIIKDRKLTQLYNAKEHGLKLPKTLRECKLNSVQSLLLYN